MSGPELQQELKHRRPEIPIVFITALSDESVRPELLARGAAECLFKPFGEAALMDALNNALEDLDPPSGPDIVAAQMAAFREWEQPAGTRFADLKGVHQPPPRWWSTASTMT